MEISPRHARFLALKAQGLTSRQPFGGGLNGVKRAIDHIGYSQIDTISVVQRAHHHVLWSRVPGYDPGHDGKPSMLDRLMNRPDGVFEYWSHAAAFLPMSDYRFSLVRKHRLRSGANLWFSREDHVIKHVLERIEKEGPLASKDFKDPKKKGPGGWWSWKPTKKALEQLFMDGTLMVKERQGFQKVFDLTERVLPEGADTRIPSIEEFVRWLIIKMLKAHGLASLIEISYWSRGIKEIVAAELEPMIEEGTVVKCRVGSTRKRRRKTEVENRNEYFALAETLGKKPVARYSDDIRILNPFDNAIIQRKRILNLFDFDYVFECYVPARKRKFGYFSLPLLFRDEFVGLIDCKTHRKERRLEVVSSHFLGKKPMPEFRDRLSDALEHFATFNGCSKISF